MSVRPGFMPRGDFQNLLDVLTDKAYTCIGPVVRDDAIVFEPVHDAAQFPAGIAQDLGPGCHRLIRMENERLFSWVNGPQGMRPISFKPRETLWRMSKADDGTLVVEFVEAAAESRAVIGVRACDLAALALQDRHFLEGLEPDPHYRARRENLFLVGVDCARSADTCFCASTGDGPALSEGADIGLSELDEGFLVWPGTDKGREVYEALRLDTADDDQIQRALEQTNQAALSQRRKLPVADLKERLFSRLDHGRWEKVAERCLGCGNCTLVCPTCFCYGTRSEVSLDGAVSSEIREWDSCFNQEHSYVSGFLVRPNICLRYRQWLTHKLAGWHEQFDRSGCVGCGRCIVWCPTGIDLTREVAALLGEDEGE